jgi:hypothetical protein
MAVIFSLLLGMNFASARTFYVALNGNNNNSGTLTQPWRTISYAVSSASGIMAGDTISVRAGNYPESVTPQVSGVPASSILLKNHGKETVILNPGKFTFTNGINYWKLEGLDIEHSDESGVEATGTHAVGFLTIDGCILSHHKENGVALFGSFGGVYVYDCVIEWNGEINGLPSGVEGTGIVMYGSAGKLWAKRNWIAHNWAKGISHGTEANWLTDGSFMDSNLVVDNFESGIDWWGDNTAIRYNYFSLNGTRDTENDEFGDKGLAIGNPGSSNTIAFNVLKSSGRWELEVRGATNKIYNNTLLKDHYYTVVPGSPYAAAIIFWASNQPGNEFKNNLIINTVSQAQHHFAIIAETYLRYTDQVWSHNLYWSPNSVAAPPENRPFKLYGSPGGTYMTLAQIQSLWPNEEIGSLYANPQFVSLPDSNLALEVSSPAVDAGVYVGFPFNGQAPDMGRFEFSDGGTPPWAEPVLLDCVDEQGETYSYLISPPLIPVLSRLSGDDLALLAREFQELRDLNTRD